MDDVDGMERIESQEVPPKDREKGNGWNGAYVSFTAGAGSGTIAATNRAPPFGASGQVDK